MQVYCVGVTVGLHMVFTYGLQMMSAFMDSSWKFGKEMQNQ